MARPRDNFASSGPPVLEKSESGHAIPGVCPVLGPICAVAVRGLRGLCHGGPTACRGLLALTVPQVPRILGVMQYWLVKQEPGEYSWADFVAEGGTAWTGVRNYQARNHLRTMWEGDWVAFYHSGSERAVVGLARVRREAYPDPTAQEGDWVAVDLAPAKPLARAVTLAEIKADPVLRTMALVRQSRLSVLPVTEAQWNRLLALGQTRV